MKTYLVFKREENVKVVPDSVSFLAAIFSVIWILYHRLWHLLLIFSLYTALAFYLHKQGFISGAIYSLLICFALPYLWVYGNFWRQKKLLRKGFVASNVVTAKNYDEALYKAL